MLGSFRRAIFFLFLAPRFSLGDRAAARTAGWGLRTRIGSSDPCHLSASCAIALHSGPDVPPYRKALSAGWPGPSTPCPIRLGTTRQKSQGQEAGLSIAG
jgi:hypothetical protein